MSSRSSQDCTADSSVTRMLNGNDAFQAAFTVAAFVLLVAGTIDTAEQRRRQWNFFTEGSSMRTEKAKWEKMLDILTMETPFLTW